MQNVNGLIYLFIHVYKFTDWRPLENQNSSTTVNHSKLAMRSQLVPWLNCHCGEFKSGPHQRVARVLIQYF